MTLNIFAVARESSTNMLRIIHIIAKIDATLSEELDYIKLSSVESLVNSRLPATSWRGHRVVESLILGPPLSGADKAR
jgi:hypothetical protein